MTDDQLAEAKSIFQAAAELPAEKRQEFLSQRCGDNRKLRALVERLLDLHDGGIGDFLEPPDAETQVTAEPPEPLPQRIGPFEIIRKLGAGGMGTVYLARQERPQRTVALKIARLHVADALSLKRFDFEIEVLGQLNHPGIAQIYEAGTDKDGLPFFAMEYVPGEPLLDHAESRGLGLRERLELLAQVCDAVHYAHEKGVIHRDLKPGNILVAETEGSPPRPKILDFGVARAVGAGLHSGSLQTRTGTLVGTLSYMSPEQVSGRPEELDVRSDVYQLGLSLFELLAGRLPYDVEGLSVTEAMQVIREKESPQLGSLDSRFRGDITTIVGKALEKDPQRRYATAADLASDIRRHLADEPIIARPPSVTYRVCKLIRRRRSLIGMFGMGLVLAAAVVVFWWGGREPTESKKISARRIVAEDYGGTKQVYCAMSPDGQSVACSQVYDLTLATIGTGEAQAILEEQEGRLFLWIDWHPDGKRLLTEEWHTDHYETWFTDVVTRRREPVRETNEPTFPAVSPDGHRLAFLREELHELRIGEITGGEGSTVLRVEELEELDPPVWAPDGTHLAYTVTYKPDGRVTLETVDLSGNRSRLVEDTRINMNAGAGPRLCWLPDGRLVYDKWARHDAAGGELVVVDVDLDSGQLRQGPRRFFSMEGARLSRPSASRDGKRLAFVREVWGRSIMLLEGGRGAEELELRPVSPTGWIAYPGVWSADGQKIFFSTERKTGDLDIYVRDLNARREKPFVVSPRSEHPQCLTPDGSLLLYTQDQDLMSIPVIGGDSNHVLRLEHDYTGAWVRCAFAPDSLCVIVEFDGTAVVVRPFHLDGSVDAELLRVDVDVAPDLEVGFDLSPDGSQFVVTEFTGRIRLFDLSTGVSRELPNEWEGNPQKVFWSRNGEHLYLSGLNGPAYFWIVRLDLVGGYEVLYESADDWAWLPVPSPDERSVVFHMTRFGADIWMIEGF